jgi:heptosyltransferase-2
VALATEPCAILPVIPQPRLLVDPASVAKTTETFLLPTKAGKILGLCPGAEYGPAKRWPETHYTEVAKKAIENGWQVYLFGSAKDKAVAATINELSGGACSDFAGKTSLTQALDLMSLCDAVVSNDSGLMHVAAALNIKTIALYGSSDPTFTPPLHPDAQVITLGLECSPCFKRECPLGHLDCLTKILPERVLALLDVASVP